MDGANSLDDSADASGHFSKDPVCGARVRTLTAVAREEYEGLVHHFCSHACYERFKARPEAFVGRSAQPQ